MSKVAVLISTYNRPKLLSKAINSVLTQSFTDVELHIIDDASTDDETANVVDRYWMPKTLHYTRLPENVGSKLGDKVHIERLCDIDAEYVCYLCDDDRWTRHEQLAEQVATLEQCPKVAFVMGGMMHSGSTFIKHAYPKPDMTGDEFLRSLAEKPGDRNIVLGATLFRKSMFAPHDCWRAAQGVRWQSGYVMLCHPAIFGDVVYIDAPLVLANVSNGTNASFRGTQYDHLCDALASVDAGFLHAPAHPSRAALKTKIFDMYMANRTTHRAGTFKHPCLVPEITDDQFAQAFEAYLT